MPDVPSSPSAPASSVSRSPVEHINDPVLPWRPTRSSFDIVVSSTTSFLLLRNRIVRIVVVIFVPIAGQIASPALPSPGLDVLGRVRLGSDMRVISRPVEDRGIKVWKIMQQVDEVVFVVAQVVGGSACNANLVFSAKFESVSFVPNLCEEPKSVFRGGRSVLNHLRELVDFGGDERHGG